MTTASSIRLLIVDDHSENRLVARWMAQRAFQEPVLREAATLAEAQGILGSEQFDAVLLDAAITDFSAACSVLAQRTEEACCGFVLLVGATEQAQRQFGEELGLEHWVVKELLSAYTLELVVRRAVDNAGARQRLAEHERNRVRLSAERDTLQAEIVELQSKLAQATAAAAEATTVSEAQAASPIEKHTAVALASSPSLAGSSAEARPKLIPKEVSAADADGQPTARRLQTELAPPGSPLIEGFEIAGLSLPAEATGGDYYDYLPCGDGLLCITVGECSGRGLAPTMLATSLRAYLRVLTASMTDVSDIVSQANRLITEDIGDEEFLVTMMLVQIDQVTKRIQYSSAGHQGYHLDREGRSQILHSTGMPMGLGAETVIPEGPPLRLKAGEVLLLVTDGIQKMTSESGERFGVERMLNVVREHHHLPPRMIVSELKKACLEFAKGGGQCDDITAVIVRAEGGNGMHF